MTRPLRPHRGPALALLAVALTGCASQRERAAWTSWDDLNATFRPVHDQVAPLTSASGLATYVELALARSPALQAASQRWRADLERVPQARGLPDPELRYGGFVEPIETRVGPQRHRFGVAQRLPWPGKLAYRGGVALEQAEASRAQADAARWRLIADVTTAYADYYDLAQERQVTHETLALVQHWESVAQARLRAGAAAGHRDVIKAQVEIGRLEDRLATLTHARAPRVERLRALLGVDDGLDLPWPQTLPDRRLALDDAEVLAQLPQHSPRLRALDRQVAARNEGVDLAWQSYLPDLLLGVDYVEVGPADRVGGQRPRGSGDDAIVANVGLSLPIWFGRYDAQVAEARARLRAAEFDRLDAGRDLQAAVTRALFDYRDAERKQALYGDTLVPKAEESLQATAAAYEAGTGDFLDVLDAERVLLEFHLAQQRALADRVVALAELESLAGVALDRRPGGAE